MRKGEVLAERSEELLDVEVLFRDCARLVWIFLLALTAIILWLDLQMQSSLIIFTSKCVLLIKCLD